jgi:hypothetical protein
VVDVGLSISGGVLHIAKHRGGVCVWVGILVGLCYLLLMLYVYCRWMERIDEKKEEYE